jgi:hypothetical protein
MRAVWLLRGLTLLGAIAALGLAPTAAAATRAKVIHGGRAGGAHSRASPSGRHGRRSGGAGAPGSANPNPSPSLGSRAGRTPGGTANPLPVTNPLCTQYRLSGEARRNCETGGGPEAPTPVSNLGFDIHVDDSGSAGDAIVGHFQEMLASIANAIWGGALFILKLIFTLLGWGFALSPFTNGGVMGSIDSGLHRFYAAFTQPWLLFAFVCLGAWAAYRGLIKREAAASVGGLLASIVLMLAALWIIDQPAETIGTVSRYVNQAALSVIAAPQGGSPAKAPSTYGEATGRVWNTMTTPGFAALQFSDQSFAYRRPDWGSGSLGFYWLRVRCFDSAIPYSSAEWAALTAQYASGQVIHSKACKDYYARLGTPRHNYQLFLDSSPGSVFRSDAMWNHFDGSPEIKDKLAIEGGSGMWVRLPLIFLLIAGLAGGALLFGWLALQLFMQACVAFVLVLATPLALLFPAFGEKGRGAFRVWGAVLLGALISKLVYAALLAIVLFGTTVIAKLGGSGDGVTAWMELLLAAGFWWGCFLKRNEVTGWMSVSEAEPGSGHGGALGLYGGLKLGQMAWRASAGRALGAGRAPAGRAAGGAGVGAPGRAASAASANERLDRRAGATLDGEYERRRAIVDQNAANEAELRALEAKHGKAIGTRANASAGGPGVLRHPDDRRAERLRASLAERSPEELERSRAFVAAADESESRTGERWTRGDLDTRREQLRRSLDRPASDPVHAHYIGKTPGEYRHLLDGGGPQAVEAQLRIRERIREDKRAFSNIPDAPDGLPSRASSLRYRGGNLIDAGRRARREGGGATEVGKAVAREHGQMIAARRRGLRDRPRRGLSR